MNCWRLFVTHDGGISQNHLDLKQFIFPPKGTRATGHQWVITKNFLHKIMFENGGQGQSREMSINVTQSHFPGRTWH